MMEILVEAFQVLVKDKACRPGCMFGLAVKAAIAYSI
jgi:hypothetical protein